MKTMMTALALGASAFLVSAQDNNDGPPGGGPGGPGGLGGPGGRHRPPPPAIVMALDANHDGVIDAGEIANAVAVLRALDKNGDGRLTPDEFIGPRPPRPGGPGGNAGGNTFADDDNLPPGPPPGAAGGPPDGAPPGPPPGQQ